MKIHKQLASAVLLMVGAVQGLAQASSGTDLDLSTRCIGAPPMHTTVSSVAQWMQNPLDQRLQIAVTNLYALTNDYMEIVIDGQHEKFYGAGIDQLGNYIPTNYPPVTVNAILRRVYQMSVMCPNSGPNGSPLFKIGDLDPNSFLPVLTNSPTDAVSQFLWTNFTAQGQIDLTNDAATYEQEQTNLTWEVNRIIEGPCIYDTARFGGIQLSDATTNLLYQSPPPTGQMLTWLNRLLLTDAYSSFGLPAGNPDNSGTAQINFSVMPPPELIVSKTHPAPSYTVLVNNDSSSGGVLNLQNPGTGYASTNNSTIEVLKDRFGHVALGDGCDDATKAPGQGNWLSMGPGCTQDTNRISLRWHVSLGRNFDGLAAGQLALAEPGLTRDSYTPHAVYYNGAMTNLYATETFYDTNLPSLITNSDGSITTNQFVPVLSQNVWTNSSGSLVTNRLVPVVLLLNNVAYLMTNSAGGVYTNYDAVIRQVNSYQTFVDVLTPDTNDTVLNFYFANQVGTNRDVTGLYTNISGSPFVTWTIQNPNPTTCNDLNIIETRNGISSTQSLVKATSGGQVTWTLTLGAGTEQRVETRQITFVGSPATNRVELDTISYANSSTPAYQCQETYHSYPWGWELIQTSLPNGATPLITSYEYYDDINNPETYSANGNGQLKQIVYPDGYWEKHVYEDIDNGDHSEVGGYYDPYAPGLLRYIFYPEDSENGGVDSPDDATPFNSLNVKFGYFVSGSAIIGRHMVTYDGLGLNFDDTWHSSVRNEDAWKEESLAPDGQPSEFSISATVMWQEDVGDWSSDYSEASVPGLAGHSWDKGYRTGDGLRHFYFYDHGAFDDGANQFNLDSTDHLYGTGATNNYPDWQQSEVLYFYPADEPYGCALGSDDYYLNIQDHPISSYWDPNTVQSYEPNITRKRTEIMQNGNLVQTEMYVYTSAGGVSGGVSQDPQWALLYKMRYYPDSLGRATNVVRIDGISGQTRTVYTADYRGDTGYDGELLLSETDENGRQTSYTYDSLQRVKTATLKGFGNQPDQVTTYSYDADERILGQVVTADSLSTSESWAFDSAGRQTNCIDQAGIATQTSYSADNRTVTISKPGGITISQAQFIDRRPQSLQGNGVVQEFYGYDILGYDDVMYPEVTTIRRTKTYLGAATSARWSAQGQDGQDLNAWEEHPIGMGTTNTSWVEHCYGANIHPFSDLSSTGNAWDYYYDDAFGAVSLKPTFASGDATGYSDYWLAGNNRSVVTNRASVEIDGSWFEAETNLTFLTDASDERTVTGIHLEQLNGFSGNTIACAIDYDADTNETVTVTTLDRANNLLTVTISKPNTSSLTATNIFQNGEVISGSTLSVASPTLYYYDALGRTNVIQDPLGNLTSLTYDQNTGWLTSVTDLAGHTTSYSYYSTNEANAGMLKCQADANDKKSYYTYTMYGKLYQTWGDVPCPAEYRYNEFGDLTNRITFRGGSGWSGSAWPSPDYGTGDNTYWVYDDASGELLQKIDAQGHAVTYAYDTTTGRLLTRSWARMIGTDFVTVTNYYDGFGDLTEQDYNDGTPSVYFNNYNRSGQPREIVDGVGTNEMTYDYASRMVSSAYVSGPLAGITASNHFNPYFGRDALNVSGTNGWNLTDNYGYDAYGRLGSVSSGNCSATYGYVPNTDLLQSTTFKNGASTVLTTTRDWNYGFQLRDIVNSVNGTPVTSDSYQYDAVNRRTRATLEDNSYWQYGYNDRNELTGAQRNWSYLLSHTPVAGQQFGYGYDNIGNRTTASFGGDANGANLQTATYAANSLNQYTNIVTPGFKDIMGAALATNGVTVNGGVADRHGEYFHKGISVANTNIPIWQTATVISGGVTNGGGDIFPANDQRLVYDADGNLSFDGVWTYKWDGENRLIQMTMTNVGAIVDSNRLQLSFGYDYLGRRVSKAVYAWNGSNFGTNPVQQTMLLYDGQNLEVEMGPSNILLRSYIWGHDVSGTFTGAGGVGGLLATQFYTNSQPSILGFCAYDGNANVTALINATDKSVIARYEYDPFGQLIRNCGPVANQNPFRFSTKYYDEETGLTYFSSRFYSSQFGRWISRDGGNDPNSLNQYTFVLNNPNSGFDPNGEFYVPFQTTFVAIITSVKLFLSGDPEDMAQAQEIVAQVKESNERMAEMEEDAEKYRLEGEEGESMYLNRKFRKQFGEQRERTRFKFNKMFTALAVGAMAITAQHYADVGAIAHLAGDNSSCSIVQMYHELDNGDQGEADLDAVTAALDETGSTDEAALIAVGINYEAEDIYSTGSTSLSPSQQAEPEDTVVDLTIKI